MKYTYRHNMYNCTSYKDQKKNCLIKLMNCIYLCNYKLKKKTFHNFISIWMWFRSRVRRPRTNCLCVSGMLAALHRLLVGVLKSADAYACAIHFIICDILFAVFHFSSTSRSSYNSVFFYKFFTAWLNVTLAS